jgi:hypothetical protein
LCLAFNRPDLLAEVLAAVRVAGPRKVFVSIDGPRPDHQRDLELCDRVRELAEGVDWATEVHVKAESRNLGVRAAVESAVSWALEDSKDIIVLEDDCVPDPTFFAFCDQLLARYRDDERVMQISGTNWGAGTSRFLGYSYAFTSFAPIWGWATWRRAWRMYDSRFDSWPRVKATGLADGLALSRRFRRLLEPEWDLVNVNGGEWDRKWQYSILRQHGLNICPAQNLVKNIGFRDDATHLKGSDRIFSHLSQQPMTFPLNHPPEVARNAGVESVFERIYWQKRGWPARIFSAVVRHPRVNQMMRMAWRNVLTRPS